MGILIDLTNRKFGRLLVIERVPNPRETKSKHRDSWWSCSCDCGGLKIVRGESLRTGRTQSCGCLNIEHLERTRRKVEPHPDGAFFILYGRYKYHAKERNLSFSLTKEQFRSLTSGQCHYCGRGPCKTIVGKWSTSSYDYNGIDRKNNDLGYFLDNCVTCCYICNKSKHVRTYEEYISWLNDLTEYRVKCMKSEQRITF